MEHFDKEDDNTNDILPGLAAGMHCDATTERLGSDGDVVPVSTASKMSMDAVDEEEGVHRAEGANNHAPVLYARLSTFEEEAFIKYLGDCKRSGVRWCGATFHHKLREDLIRVHAHMLGVLTQLTSLGCGTGCSAYL